MGPDDTSHLIHGALGGDEAARSALLERLRPRLVLWAATRLSAKLRASYEPEDVAQEVLIAVHKGWGGFHGGDGHAVPEIPAFLSWVFRIAENRIRDLADREGAEKRRLPEPRSFTQTSPSSVAARDEQIQRLKQALAELPPDYQDVIRLRRFQGLECSDVAAILERSENAVRILYWRALRTLRDRLGSRT